MATVTGTLAADGVSEQERDLIKEWNGLWDARAQAPEGSAAREQLERRMATIEIALGL